MQDGEAAQLMGVPVPRIFLITFAAGSALVGLSACVKQLRGAKAWTRACDTLREEIVCFVRERLGADERDHLRCSIR